MTLNYSSNRSSSNRSSSRSRGGRVGEEEGCGASGGSGEIVGAAFFFSDASGLISERE